MEAISLYPNLFIQKVLKEVRKWVFYTKIIDVISGHHKKHTISYVKSSICPKSRFKIKYLPSPKLTVLLIQNTTTTKRGAGKIQTLQN